MNIHAGFRRFGQGEPRRRGGAPPTSVDVQCRGRQRGGALFPWQGTGEARPARAVVALLPIPKELVFQAVDADDVADAYSRLLQRRAESAFNIAAEPILDPNALGWVFNTRRLLP